MRPLAHLLLIALAISIAAPARAAEPDPLDAVDCAALRVDFVSLLPDLITPQRLKLPEAPPFTDDVVARLGRASNLDPAGLCRYRDANRALAKAGPRRVIFYGDSITEYWALAAPELFQAEVLDRGVSGQSTDQMLIRFRRDVLDLKPAVVHILGGINDAMGESGALSTRANIMAMVELAQANGVRVVLGGLTPATQFWLAPGIELGAHVRSTNSWLKAYATQRRIAFVDYAAVLTDANGAMRAELSNDHLHPNRNGYALMTPLARRAVARALAGR